MAIDPTKLSTIDNLVTALSSLLTNLLQAGRNTTDDTQLLQINNEYSAVQTLMDQATQARIAADDVTFIKLTSTLKAQAALLQGMEKQIQSIVSDVALAGQIVGYLAQAVAYLAKL